MERMIAPEELRTERLRLRPLRPGDAPEVRRIAGDYEVYRMTSNIPYPYPEGAAERFIEATAGQFRDGRAYTYAICEYESERLVGCIGLSHDRENDKGEAGYWIGREHWGRGYCTEALSALIEMAFERLGYHRVYARHMTTNPASGRVMLKCGMRSEGVHRGDCKKDGAYLDLEVHAIVRGDYEQMRKDAPRGGG